MKNTISNKMILMVLAVIMAGILFSTSNLMAGDSCPSSIMGIHGVSEWDGYGTPSDFQGTINHITLL